MRAGGMIDRKMPLLARHGECSGRHTAPELATYDNGMAGSPGHLLAAAMHTDVYCDAVGLVGCLKVASTGGGIVVLHV